MTKPKIRCEKTRVFYGGLIQCKLDRDHDGAHHYHVRVNALGQVWEPGQRRPNPGQTLIRWR